jgi:hypothetical protein
MIRKMLSKLSEIKRGLAAGSFGAFLDRLKLKFFPGRFAGGGLSESLLSKRKNSESRHENKFSENKFSENKFSGNKFSEIKFPRIKFARNKFPGNLFPGIKLSKFKGSAGETSASGAPKRRFLKIDFPKLTGKTSASGELKRQKPKRSLDKPLSIKLPGRKLPEGVRRMGVFAGWIAGLVLAGSLLWGFTQPLRGRMLLASVNRVLALQVMDLRLERPISPWRMPGRASQAGTWYTTSAGSEVWAVVFPLMIDGIFSPVLGVISAEGTAEALIPLSNHSAVVFERLPRSYLQVYIRRIEAGYAVLRNSWESKNE